MQLFTQVNHAREAIRLWEGDSFRLRHDGHCLEQLVDDIQRDTRRCQRIACRLYKPNGFRPQYIVEVEAVEMENTIGIDLINRGDWLRQALRKAPEREVKLADIEIIREMVLGFNKSQRIR